MAPTDPPPAALRALAPHAAGRAWRAAAPGFSGARVWRGDAPGAPPVALKVWPAGVGAERVARVHAWQARAAGLPFVPRVLALGFAGGRACELGAWLPGAPVPAPSPAQLGAACAALAELHAAWAAEWALAPCPAVAHRLRALRARAALWAGPPPPVAPELDPVLRAARAAVAARAAHVARALGAWEGRAVRVQPCLRDARAAHVLFEGDRVRGLIDYGAADPDAPAADLARYLADATDGGDGAARAGVAAYRAAGGADPHEELVLALARTGPVCSLLGWLVRLVGRREAVDAGAAAARIGELLRRAGYAPVE